jgi:ferredoxin
MSLKFINRHTREVEDSGHCLQGLNVLAHAQLIELDIGSQCGGKARCGKDWVWIASEDRKWFNSPEKIEVHHLGSEAVGKGWRLACQAFPSRDNLEIQIHWGGQVD